MALGYPGRTRPCDTTQPFALPRQAAEEGRQVVEGMTTTDLTRAAAAIRRAQLADMKDGEIIAYLRERGYTVSARPFSGASRRALADEDEIPFDGSDRRE